MVNSRKTNVISHHNAPGAIHSCRYCRLKIHTILSLGTLPLVNYFPRSTEISKEKRYPLDLVVCESCGLVQLGYIVPETDIFLQYHYATGASRPLVQELKVLASDTIQRLKLKSGRHVLDIGANDGTLLSYFKEKQISVLGVEPSGMMADRAIQRGIPTMKTFFTQKVAKDIVQQYGQFDVVFATHTLANIVDLPDFFRGINEVLAPEGECILEVADFDQMVKMGAFDAVYHEHYSYFNFASLSRILSDFGFAIVEIKHVPAQGGSIRIVAKRAVITHRVDSDIHRYDYISFVKKITLFRKKFRKLMDEYSGQTIVGFGAPAKAVTLLSYCGISVRDIAYIVDSTPVKQGRVLPGIHVPIVSEAALIDHPADVILILAWNYQREILKKVAQLVKKKTIIIIPFPELNVIEYEPIKA